MATIEQLLGATSDEIAAMNDEQLKVYLKDIFELEPKKVNKPLVGNEEDEKEDEEDEPIKKRGRKKGKLNLKEMEEELKELEKSLGL